ncbi:MAG: hypothetical protein U0992_13560 [Planctomycetaceae bacterium]
MQTQHKAAENKYLQDLYELAESIALEAETYDGSKAQRPARTGPKGFRSSLVAASIPDRRPAQPSLRSEMLEEMGLIGDKPGCMANFKHDGTSEGMLMLKAKAQWFPICLNNEKRKDHQVVVQEATGLAESRGSGVGGE